MTTTVSSLFKDRNDAVAAVRELKAANVPEREISLVTNRTEGQSDERSAGDRTVDNNMAETGAADGAAIGGVLGGGAGLLAGLGALTIPGLGPVIGAGWLVTTAIGAAVGASGGGIIGALVGAGVDNDDAQIYVEGIKRGGTLVSVRVADDEVPTVEAIMTKYRGLDHDALAADRSIETTVTRETSTRTVPPAE
jgi:hypothetical protein